MLARNRRVAGINVVTPRGFPQKNVSNKNVPAGGNSKEEGQKKKKNRAPDREAV